MLLIPILLYCYALILRVCVQSLIHYHKAVAKKANDCTHVGTCRGSEHCSIKKWEENRVSQRTRIGWRVATLSKETLATKSRSLDVNTVRIVDITANKAVILPDGSQNERVHKGSHGGYQVPICAPGSCTLVAVCHAHHYCVGSLQVFTKINRRCRRHFEKTIVIEWREGGSDDVVCHGWKREERQRLLERGQLILARK